MRAGEMALAGDAGAAGGGGAAGLIAQTDENGNPLGRAGGAPQPAHLARAGRPLPPHGVEEEPSCWCCVCNTLINFFCCLPPVPPARSSGPTHLLLPPQSPSAKSRKCLVLDLDETLVHSSFKPIPNPDYVIPVVIDDVTHQVYVLKRPGVDLFLERLGSVYEIVVFTASLAKYADPLLDKLDTKNVVSARLFRDACTFHQDYFVKDLAMLGRPVKNVIIVDNSPASYMFQPENAIGISTFIDNMEDRELYYCLPFLESIKDVDDVTKTLHTYPDFIAREAAESRLPMPGS